MYWFNVSKLADDLRDGRSTKKGLFKYLLASLLALNMLVYSGNTLKNEDLLSTTEEGRNANICNWCVARCLIRPDLV